MSLLLDALKAAADEKEKKSPLDLEAANETGDNASASNTGESYEDIINRQLEKDAALEQSVPTVSLPNDASLDANQGIQAIDFEDDFLAGSFSLEPIIEDQSDSEVSDPPTDSKPTLPTNEKTSTRINETPHTQATNTPAQVKGTPPATATVAPSPAEFNDSATTTNTAQSSTDNLGSPPCDASLAAAKSSATEGEEDPFNLFNDPHLYENEINELEEQLSNSEPNSPCSLDETTQDPTTGTTGAAPQTSDAPTGTSHDDSSLTNTELLNEFGIPAEDAHSPNHQTNTNSTSHGPQTPTSSSYDPLEILVKSGRKDAKRNRYLMRGAFGLSILMIFASGYYFYSQMTSQYQAPLLATSLAPALVPGPQSPQHPVQLPQHPLQQSSQQQPQPLQQSLQQSLQPSLQQSPQKPTREGQAFFDSKPRHLGNPSTNLRPLRTLSTAKDPALATTPVTQQDDALIPAPTHNATSTLAAKSNTSTPNPTPSTHTAPNQKTSTPNDGGSETAPSFNAAPPEEEKEVSPQFSGSSSPTSPPLASTAQRRNSSNRGTEKTLPVRRSKQAFSQNVASSSKTTITAQSLSDLNNQAYALFHQRAYPQALKLYNQVLSHQPRNRDGLLGKAAIAMINGETAQASEFYKLLLQINPKDTTAHTALSSLYQYTDPQQQRAKLLFQLRENPQSDVLHFALGNLYAAAKNWQAAQDSYFNAWSIDANNADYCFNLALSLDRLSKPKQALKLYQKSLILARAYHSNFPQQPVKERIDQLNNQLGIAQWERAIER